MSIESKLSELGLKLPPAPSPAGNYLPAVRSGNLLFVAGTIAVRDGEIVYAGQVGREQTVETAYEAAKLCALNALASIKGATGDLEKVRIVLVNGYVNAVSGFTESPQVINGASDLFVAVLGEKGKHARAAVAAAGLPRNTTVEIQVVAEIEE